MYVKDGIKKLHTQEAYRIDLDLALLGLLLRLRGLRVHKANQATPSTFSDKFLSTPKLYNIKFHKRGYIKMKKRWQLNLIQKNEEEPF